jgi:hypothetical protein
MSSRKGTWAAPGRFYTTDLCCTWTCLTTTAAWAAPGLLWTKGAWGDLAGHVYTTRTLAALGRVYTYGAWAAPVLLLDLSTLYTTEVCEHLDVSSQQGPELHLNVFGQLELLSVSLCLYRYTNFCTRKSHDIPRYVVQLWRFRTEYGRYWSTQSIRNSADTLVDRGGVTPLSNLPKPRRSRPEIIVLQSRRTFRMPKRCRVPIK